MKTTVKTLGILCLALVGLITITNLSSCNEEEPTKKVDPPVSTKDYLIFDGHKVELNSPTNGNVQKLGGDTSLVWRGNQPSGVEGDTVFSINHYVIDETLSYVVNDDAFEKNEVNIGIRWGTLYGKPIVLITGGGYTLKRENGILISTLKNGTGVWKDANGDIKNPIRELNLEPPGQAFNFKTFYTKHHMFPCGAFLFT